MNIDSDVEESECCLVAAALGCQRQHNLQIETFDRTTSSQGDRRSAIVSEVVR
jgi:hypothetical protein